MYSVSDAAKHTQDLTQGQQAAWARIANAALAECERRGDADAEAQAIRIANAGAKRVHSASESAIASFIEGALSHGQTRDLLQAAIKVGKGPHTYCYPRDVFDDFLVYEEESPGVPQKLYKRSFSILDGKVTLGEAVEVRLVTNYEPVKEGALAESELEIDQLVSLTEAIGKDGVVSIKLIAPGWGSSGYYPREMLERDGPKVFTKGTQMFMDHPTSAEERERPERSVKDLAAVLVGDSKFQEHPKFGPGLYAPAKITGNWKPVLEELAPHIGVSIRAMGKQSKADVAREGRTGKEIEALVAARSVDFVTQAGAGGRFAQLFESARAGAVITANDNDAEEAKRMAEAKELTELKTRAETAEAENKKLKEDNARMGEGETLRQAKDLVTAAVGKTDLPDVTKARLVEALAKNPPVRDGKIDLEAFAKSVTESVKSEREYIAKITGTGQVRGMGGAAAPTADDKATEATIAESLSVFGIKPETAQRVAAGRN